MTEETAPKRKLVAKAKAKPTKKAAKKKPAPPRDKMLSGSFKWL
jgi:hypothetical protein